MKEVLVVVGAGSIGQAIARRVGAGKKVLLAGLEEQQAAATARTFHDAGFDAHATRVDISGVVISSQSGHRLSALTPEQDKALATTPVEDLLNLDLVQPGRIRDTLHAYQLSKRGNSLRVMAEAVRWGRRGARVNTISPGIIITPLADDELNGPRGAGYRRMIEGSPAGRAGTPDEVGSVAALLMGPEGAFITGSDFLMDGGVTASYRFGDLAPEATPY